MLFLLLFDAFLLVFKHFLLLFAVFFTVFRHFSLLFFTFLPLFYAAIAFSPDCEHLAVASKDGFLRIYHFHTQAYVHPRGHSSADTPFQSCHCLSFLFWWPYVCLLEPRWQVPRGTSQTDHYLLSRCLLNMRLLLVIFDSYLIYI